MLGTRRSRVSALACLLVAGSGWVPIPLPARQVESWLQGFVLAGKPLEIRVEQCVVRWAPARAFASGVQIWRDGRLLFRTEEARLRLGLIPGRKDFLAPRSLALEQPELELDPGLIEALGEGGPVAGSADDRAMALVLQGGRLRWADPEREIELEFEVEEFRGRLTNEEGVLHGRLRSSFGISAAAWLRVEDSFTRWSLDLVAQGHPTQAPFGDLLPFRVEADSCAARIHLEQGPDRPLAGEMDLRLSEVLVDGGPFPAAIALDQLSARGNLSDGVKVDLHGAAEGIEWSAAGWLSSEAGRGLSLRLAGATAPVMLDAERIRSLGGIEPGLREVLEALELRGRVQPRFALHWEEGLEPQWAGIAPLEGMQLTYRGFLEADGDKPSFPYPVTGVRGQVVAAGTDLLIQAQGAMGEATLDAAGVVRIHSGPSGLMLDIDVSGLPLDARVTRAVSGTPDVAAVWRELGGPDGGSADVRVRLRRERGVPELGLQISGDVQDTRLRVTALPVQTVCESAEVVWSPGSAVIDGEIRTLGGRGRVKAAIRKVVDGERAQLSGTLQAAGLSPSEEERKVLESYLDLPDAFDQLQWSGDSQLRLSLRKPARSDGVQLDLRLDPAAASFRWLPTELDFDAGAGGVQVWRSGSRTWVQAPRLALQAAEGRVELSAHVDAPGADQEAQGRVLVRTSGTQLTPVVVRTLSELTGTDVADRLGWSGACDFVGELAIPAGREFRARADLISVIVEEREYLPGNRAELAGRVEIDGERVSCQELRVTSPAGELRLTDVEFVTGEEGSTLGAVLSSPDGIVLGERLSALASPDAWAALERIGLGGRVGADHLRLALVVEEQGPRFSLSGKLLLRAMSIEGPPRMRRGAGEMVVREFTWSGPDEFAGDFVLRDGRVQVSDLAVQDITARVSLHPEAIRFERFDGSLLGGRVTTFGVDENGEEVEGSIELGLDANAPLGFVLFLEDLSLARVREELDLGGNLDGIARGWLRFRSASPSPLDYTGEGHLEFRDGVLGTVPILAQMWRVAGVRAPVFDRGRVEFYTSAELDRGTIRIEDLELNHDLLEVRGSGWIDMDSYVRMKATVRTFSFFGRLPILKEFLDLFVEQDIYGPISRPKIRQRALGKLMGRDRTTETFPLWVPGLERRDWRASPALPLARDPED